MSVLRNVPQTDYPIGQTIIGPDNVPGNINQYVFTAVQNNWPNAGDRAFNYVIQVSQDGGTTWDAQTADSIDDIIIPPKFGRPGGQFNIVCDIPDKSQGVRKVRCVFDFFKPITMTINVDGNIIIKAASSIK